MSLADELLGKIREILDSDETLDGIQTIEQYLEFMNLVEDLDCHLVSGGNLPADWLEAQFFGAVEEAGEASPDRGLN